MPEFWIAPSILSANFARLGDEVDAVLAAGADLIHFDVMDNHYVPNLTIGPLVCEALQQHGVSAPIDVHLMVKPVDRIIGDFVNAGATYISPFVGRLDDIAESGMELISQIKTIYNHYDYKTQILVASVRHPMHIIEAGLIGAHVSTVPFKVLKQLSKHPLTDIGLKKFLKDWEKVPK